MEDKTWLADEIDKPEFGVDRTGRLPDPMMVRAAKKEELKELERRV